MIKDLSRSSSMGKILNTIKVGEQKISSKDKLLAQQYGSHIGEVAKRFIQTYMRRIKGAVVPVHDMKA